MNDSHIFFPVWTSPLKLRLVYLPVWHLHRQFKHNKYKVELKFPIKLAPLVDVPTAASGSFIFLVPNLVTYSQLLSVFIYNPSDSILQQILSALPSWIGEGNGKPLQCSFLENPRDGGAWWAAISGVAQSLTRLKRLSSSSSWCSQNIFTFIILFYSHHKLSQEIKQGRDWGLGRRTLYLWATLCTFLILEETE